MTQKTALILLVIILALFGLWIYLDRTASVPDGAKTLFDEAVERGDKNFSFGGTVTGIDGDKIQFRTGRVEASASGNQFVEDEVTLVVSDQTAFYKNNLTSRASLADLKVGSLIVADVVGNPFEQRETPVVRILIRE